MSKYVVTSADSGNVVGIRAGKADAIKLAERTPEPTIVTTSATGRVVWPTDIDPEPTPDPEPTKDEGKPSRAKYSPAERKARARAASDNWRRNLQARDWDAIEIPAEKHCKRCDQTRWAEDFGRTKSQLDGLRPYCKTCTNAIHKAWRDRKAAAAEAAATE
jgi:hypothetical protein